MVKLKGMQWAKNRYPNSGFTIVELLIVIVVIAILAAITIVAYNGVRERAARSVAQNETSQTIKKLLTYGVENNDQYPANLAAIGLVDTDSTNYQYTVDNNASPRTFCLTVTVKGMSYYQNNSNQNTPISGACEGHTAGGVVVTPPPLVCETNFIKVPGNSTFGTTDFCVMKYEAKNVAGKATSQAASTPWVSISQTNAIIRAGEACDNCELITEAQWLTIAHDLLNVPSNWTGGAVGTGTLYVGHSDVSPTTPQAASTSDTNASGYTNTGNTSGNQRRTLRLSTGEVIWDFAGNVSEWTSAQPTGGQPGAAGTGFGSREWNALNVTGTLSPNPFPSYGTPAAANWTSAQGLGQAYTSATETAQRGAVRGGAYNSGATGSGIFALSMSPYPSGTNAAYGFRVTHQ